jgi:hypothetical protein
MTICETRICTFAKLEFSCFDVNAFAPFGLDPGFEQCHCSSEHTGGDGASEAGEMSEASEAGEASGVSETIEARRCRSDAWCKGDRCTAK